MVSSRRRRVCASSAGIVVTDTAPLFWIWCGGAAGPQLSRDGDAAYVVRTLLHRTAHLYYLHFATGQNIAFATGQDIAQPPSTSKVCPVINPAASPAKKST